jgi:hypothetical protein
VFGTLFAMGPIAGLAAARVPARSRSALLFTVLWTAVALLISLSLLRWRRLLARRRENLALVAQGR